jgi:hypothetical protein
MRSLNRGEDSPSTAGESHARAAGTSRQESRLFAEAMEGVSRRLGPKAPQADAADNRDSVGAGQEARSETCARQKEAPT